MMANKNQKNPTHILVHFVFITDPEKSCMYSLLEWLLRSHGIEFIKSQLAMMRIKSDIDLSKWSKATMFT